MSTHLPLDIPVFGETLRLISEVDRYQGHWGALQGLSPEKLSHLRRIATIESVGSSTRIEGSQLSDAEVADLLGRLELESFQSRDEQEVAGYAYVMDLVFANHAEIPLTEGILFQLHRDLLRHSNKDERHRGIYKTLPNHVAAFDTDGREIGIVFATTSPFDTPGEMEALLAWHRRVENEQLLHPLLRIGIFIVKFLAIHPFQDGNGRLSRILTTLLLLRAGYGYVPYVSLEAIIEQNKEGYYMALRRAQSTLGEETPDWDSWLHFFLRCLQRQTVRLQERLSIESDRQHTLSPLAARLARLFESHETLSLSEAVKLLDANPNTLKVKFRELLAHELIRMQGKGRGTYYVKN
ncbi:MAG: Fic family protein [Akkermansiaceae bacterium]|nr:Fic family protein [Akkermansiaceae bacterium]